MMSFVTRLSSKYDSLSLSISIELISRPVTVTPKFSNNLSFIFGGECKEEPLFSYDEIGTPIVIGYRITCCNYDWVWFYKLNYVMDYFYQEDLK